MRLIYSLLLFMIATASLLAQLPVEVLAPFDFASNFNDVYVDEGGAGWAVGSCGVLARTENKGQDWEIGSVPDDLNFTAVACEPGTNCQTVYLGADFAIYKSVDGGENWTFSEIPLDSPREFEFVNDSVIIISHSNASLFRSTDSGENWTEVATQETYRGRVHFPTEDVGYLFQQSGAPLLKSSDQGATWDSIYQFEANAYYGDWLDENIGFLYDQNRRIFKTTNGGTTWDLVTDAGVPTNMRRLVALSETRLVGYVFTDNIFISEDGGATWSNNTSIGEGNFGLRFVGIHNNGNEFWLASRGTEILYSDDGLETATSQFPGVRPSLEQMAFPTNEVGYALQERMGVLKTTDGGASWNQLSNPYFTVSRDFLVFNEDDLIIPYNSSGPQSSNDGAQTYGPLFPAPIQDSTFVFNIEQLPGGRIYLIGSEHGVYSDDNGATWEVIYHGFNRFPRSLVFLDDQTGFMGADGGRIYATTNGGESWQQVVDGDWSTQPMRNLFAIDNTTIYTEVSGIRRCSSDGGATWTEEACNGFNAPGGIVIGPDGTYYSASVSFSSVANPTEIQRSTDQGQTWETIAEFCVAAVPGAITPNGRYLFLYGNAGLLARVDLDAVSTDDIQPTDITNARVYPNPTTGQLWVELPEDRTEADLVLYNLQGQQMLHQRANGVKSTMDVSALPKGLYVLQVRGEGWMQQARVVVSNP
ncbi:MAG: T9SS type A sorting domain-containing protein [Bacteroidota bacterium]